VLSVIGSGQVLREYRRDFPTAIAKAANTAERTGAAKPDKGEQVMDPRIKASFKRELQTVSEFYCTMISTGDLPRLICCLIARGQTLMQSESPCRHPRRHFR
jgi:hypothetical protein